MSELEREEEERLRRDLLDLQVELAQQLASSDAAARPVDLDQPIGRVSRIDAIQQQSMAQANRRGAQLRLQQVRAALSRLDDGEYGACAQCGEPIGFARLRVRPETPFCVSCQGRRESG
ncbi:MAG: TraR/DksA family transcriptional regulator [Myxococcota bacterium]